MTQPVISVERLSKAYRIGLKEEIPDTLMGAVTGWIKAPVRNWRRLRRLDTSAALRQEAVRAADVEHRTSNIEHPTSNGYPPPPPTGEDRSEGELPTTSDATNGHVRAPTPQPPAPASDIIWALRDVSFEVAEGEVVGIIGRNGAGKSTLLKILSRITEPTSGRAVIRGRVSSLLEVGTGFHPELTGRENVYMNGTVLGMTKREIDRKFDEIVDFSGVERFLDTPIKRYSSGMQVRLAFSVAAHLEPEILIVDEVLAVGDAEFQNRCLGKMQHVAACGRTVLFVSHNMAAVEALCSRAISLNLGAIDRIGSTATVISLYLRALSDRADCRLEHRTDRYGDRTAICKEVWFEDGLGKRIRCGRPGQPLRICMRYQLFSPSSKYQFRIGIYDDKGIPLAHNSSDCSPIPESTLPPEGIVVCLVPRLPLPPSSYYINTSIVRDEGVRADRVERAARLMVESGDYYGSGRLPPAQSGKVLLDYSWELYSGVETLLR